jgi:hypothetical protein
MKRHLSLLFATFLLVISCDRLRQARTSSDAQSEESEDPNKTKLERFAAKHGVAVIRGYSEMGSIPGEYGGSVQVTAAELTNAASGEKERGVLIRVKEEGSLERQNTSSIDYDEIESLLSGIDYISKANKSMTKLDSFQVDYATLGDFRLSTFNGSDGGVSASASSGRIAGTSVFLSLSKLGQLRTLIDTTKKKLDESTTDTSK